MKNKKHSKQTKATRTTSTKLVLADNVRKILKTSGAYKYTVRQPGNFPVLDLLVVGRRVARVTKPHNPEGFVIRLTSKPTANAAKWEKTECKEFPYQYKGTNPAKALAIVFKQAAKL